MEQQSDMVVQLIRDISEGGLSYQRRDAANALGKLEESSEDIVMALLVAKESDTNIDVRQAAAAALEAPVHQRYIQAHPEVVQNAKATVVSLETQCAQAESRERVRERDREVLRRLGVSFTVLGGLALILRLFGLELVLAGSQVTPFCGIGMIVVGSILLAVRRWFI